MLFEHTMTYDDDDEVKQNLLQMFMFNSMCYLPIVCNYSWKLLKNTIAMGQTA